jgi:peptide methionine sulfoxide reductase MsrA
VYGKTILWTKGILEIYSGYSGGTKINPTYKEVKAQEKVYRAIEKQNILKAYELKLISREEALRSLESLETPQKNNKKR